MKCLTGVLIILCLCWIALPAIAFRIYIDPGHYVGDQRTDLEIQTNLAVGLKLRALLDRDIRPGVLWEVRMSREDGKGIAGDGSLRKRAEDANNFEADLFISIHCNAGGGTGTETFWCDLNAVGQLHPNRDKDERFAHLVQKHMVNQGEWGCRNKPWHLCRRVVEDFSYLKTRDGKPYHLLILQLSDAPGCLNEIGFVDNAVDAEKLRDDQWRDKFALAYRDAIYEFFEVQPPQSQQFISIPLFHGWNVISFPGTLINSDPHSLADPGSQIQFPLYRLDPVTKKGVEVRQLKLGEGYWIKTNSLDGEVIKVPYKPTPQYTIFLEKGWNLIGSVSGRAAFNNFEGSAQLASRVLRRDPIDKKYYDVLPNDLEPGIGYYVYARVSGTLTVKVNNPGAPAAFRTKYPVSTVELPTLPPMPFEGVQVSGQRINFVPSTSKVLANFPNPFNPETWIPFQVKQDSIVTIHIYNAVGQLVRKLKVGFRPAGVYDTKDNAVYWNGQNDQGERVSSGIYFYTLQAETFQDTRKMLLLK